MKPNFIKILGISIAAFAMTTAHFSYADGQNAGRFKAAMQTCAQKLDLSTPVNFKSLDQNTRADLRSCLQGEGVSFNGHHHHWKAIRACVAQSGVTLPAYQLGQPRTALTDTQKAAVKTCAEKLRAEHQAQKTTTD